MIPFSKPIPTNILLKKYFKPCIFIINLSEPEPAFCKSDTDKTLDTNISGKVILELKINNTPIEKRLIKYKIFFRNFV